MSRISQPLTAWPLRRNPIALPDDPSTWPTVDVFIQRKLGKQAVTYPHPSLEKILKPTHGVILYQGTQDWPWRGKNTYYRYHVEDPIFFEKSYYVVPRRGPETERPYWLLYRAMASTGKVAIGRVVIRSKERLVAIREGMFAAWTGYMADPD